MEKGGRKVKRKAGILVFIFIFLLCIPTESFAASGLKLEYDGKSLIYKDKQVKYQLDEKNVNLKKCPGIIINGYSLVSYKEVFQTAMGAACSYNSATGDITIKKFNTTVKMTLGSRIAYVNGKKTTLAIAPRKIKYTAQKSTKIAVPARFVTEALGYTYQWFSETSTVKITSPYQICYNKKWYLYTGVKGQVTVDGKEINISDNPGLILDNTTLVPAKKVFGSKAIGAEYEYNSKTKRVTLTKDDVKIVFTLGSKTATVNGVKQTLTTAPRTIKDNESNKNAIMIPAGITAEALGYSYTWDKASKTSVITSKNGSTDNSGQNNLNPENNGDNEDTKDPVKNQEEILQKWSSQETSIINGYTNLISALEIFIKGDADSIKITGKIPVTAKISPVDGNPAFINIDLPGMQNTLGELLYMMPPNRPVKSITISTLSDQTTRIQVEKSDGMEYYGSAVGNEYIVTFSKSKSSAGNNSNSNNTNASGNTAYALRVAKPEGVELAGIQHEDRYQSNQFAIILPGNYVDFYNNNPIEKTGNNIKNITYQLNNNGYTEIIVETYEIQGYKLTENGSYIGITVDDPNKIYDKIVVLDPGHGGTQPGTITNSGIKEKELTKAILYTYANKWFNGNTSTIKAYWTRTNDENPGLKERGAFAEKVGADLFISLHMNSVETSSIPNGTETYYSTDNNDLAASGLTSKLLAEYFQQNLPSKLGLSGTRGVKTSGFVVIKENTVPAILIELGFVTNESDLQKLTDPAFQEEAAAVIYQLTEDIFNLYPTGR